MNVTSAVCFLCGPSISYKYQISGIGMVIFEVQQFVCFQSNQEIILGDVSINESILYIIQIGTANGVPVATMSTKTTERAGRSTTFTVNPSPQKCLARRSAKYCFCGPFYIPKDP